MLMGCATSDSMKSEGCKQIGMNHIQLELIADRTIDLPEIGTTAAVGFANLTSGSRFPNYP
jgi:hypothetical protein